MTEPPGTIALSELLEAGAEDGFAETLPDIPPELEVGRTGLKYAAGWVNEEFLPQLKNRKGIQVYREMSDNDPTVGSLLFALKRLMSELDWPIEPASDKAEDRENAELLEQCRDDMTEPWSSFVMELLSCLEYGWSWHEICWKRRLGPWWEDEKYGTLHQSKYDDGRIGIARLPIRAQESWQRWIFDGKGNATCMVQMPAPDYIARPIPRSKALHFRPSAHKNNPEGRSILRNAYRPWFMKKRMEEYEAVGVERDLAGLPVAELPSNIINALPGSKEAKMLAAYRKMVKSVRRDEQDGLVLPLDYDDKGNPKYKFSLLTSGGSRQFDTNSIITRYETRMLMTVMADFILVGHEGVGSYNLHTDKTGLFKAACNSIIQLMADELNRHLVPKLFKLNGMRPKELPRFVPQSVNSPDLAQLGAFMGSMANLGVQWFPDARLEKFVRSIADLPDMSEQDERMLEQAHRQANVMALAQQKLQAIQIGQQAAQGQQQLAQGQMQGAQQAMQVESQARELNKPGSTQPPQAGPPRSGPGRKAGASNAPKGKR